MPRAGVGWPEIYPVGSDNNPLPKKPKPNPYRDRKRAQEMYVGRRAILVSEYNTRMSSVHKNRLHAWIENFLRDMK